MAFRAYLGKREATDTPAGDSTAGGQADRALPDAVLWQELRALIRQRGACSEASATARSVWNGYDAARSPDDRTDADRA